MQKWIQSPACSVHGLHRILSSYWLAQCYLMKKSTKSCSFLVRIAEWWSSSLSSRNPKANWCLSRIFGVRFGEKDHGLSTCKPWTEEAGGLEAFLHGAAQNFELLSNIQDKKNKKLKTYSGWCPFKGLSNDTTLMQIQSGRTVPLSYIIVEEKIVSLSIYHCGLPSHTSLPYLLGNILYVCLCMYLWWWSIVVVIRSLFWLLTVM
jgi:hypothetical protein